MNRRIVTALIVLSVTSPSAAQQTFKILTPSDDTCAAFTAAMDSGEPPKTLAALGGWALGFLSGVAQGTGIDILRNETMESVIKRLYHDCHEQPTKPMSLVLEEIANTLVANH
jgi:HdeA/HdeB family protein